MSNPFLVSEPGQASPGGFDPNGRVVDAGRPVAWLTRGWNLFMKNPGMWIAITVAVLAILVVLGMVPVVGQLAANFLILIFAAGLMLGCRSLEQGGELRFEHLFAGFRQNTGNLVMVGVLYLVGLVAIMVVTFAVTGGGALTGAMMGHGAGMAMAAGSLLVAMLFMLVLMVPLVMGVWFAPALVIFHDTAPLAAMKASFSACLRNILPFLVYSVILLILGFVAAIPFMLGFLLLVPVLVGAQYASYTDIFE
ncbi:MAG: BPSS1780 family membrane protein [Candidatus Nitricoxidivorans perseverans]|uniref:BPSS1780 family membrane protein n=1 Tax=Candidatus Nitricoxidivorans perseverans TaxID=2975601 RepID=A0AA49IXK2_9PROT|nr:MAG: BPSS1780 family membrane protein [Candidatus Nitricoxidivorans perseverans]